MLLCVDWHMQTNPHLELVFREAYHEEDKSWSNVSWQAQEFTVIY